MEEEVHQPGDHQQCQQETEDGPALAFLKSNGRVVDVRGLKRAGRPKRLRAAEGHRFGAGAFGEACLPVHEHLYLSSPALLGQRLRQFGQEVFANHAGKFFREGMLDFLVAGSFNRGCVRIVGMNAESTARLGFNVEGEPGPLISGREVFRGKI